MNDWDRNNLHFLLDSDEETLNDFYSWATEDDLEYALKLVREAKTEMDVAEMELLDEATKENGLTEARQVLSRYTNIPLER
jgi:cyclopropane fatty-acyl-phospholipid synthase-like methyltransferase